MDDGAGVEPPGLSSCRTILTTASSANAPPYVVVKDRLYVVPLTVVLYGSRTNSNGASHTLEVSIASVFDCGATMAFDADSVWMKVGGLGRMASSSNTSAKYVHRLPTSLRIGVNVVDAAPVDPNV